MAKMSKEEIARRETMAYCLRIVKELESLKNQKKEVETRLNAGKDEVLADLRKQISKKEAEKAKAESAYQKKAIKSRNEMLSETRNFEETKRINREKEQLFNFKIKDT